MKIHQAIQEITFIHTNVAGEVSKAGQVVLGL
jgi:hypothetical protein